MEGFIDTQCCGVTIVVGDLNVDFEVRSQLCDPLGVDGVDGLFHGCWIEIS